MIYTNTSLKNDGWVKKGNYTYWQILQLKNGTFIGVSGGNNMIYTNTTNDLSDASWSKTPLGPNTYNMILELNDGTFVCLGNDKKIYTNTSLKNDGWVKKGENINYQIAQFFN